MPSTRCSARWPTSPTTDFDVVVTDDGSGLATRRSSTAGRRPLHDRLVARLAARQGIPRSPSALNRGALATGAATSSYPWAATAFPGATSSGHSALRRGRDGLWQRLGSSWPRALTERVLRERTPLHRWSTARLPPTTRGGGEARATLTTRDRRSVGRAALPEFAPYDKAYCCLGLCASDFAAVNGYDMRFVGWGDEDVDLAVRLRRLRRSAAAMPAGTPSPCISGTSPVGTPVRPNWSLLKADRGRATAWRRSRGSASSVHGTLDVMEPEPDGLAGPQVRSRPAS